MQKVTWLIKLQRHGKPQFSPLAAETTHEEDSNEIKSQLERKEIKHSHFEYSQGHSQIKILTEAISENCLRVAPYKRGPMSTKSQTSKAFFIFFSKISFIKWKHG